MQSGPLLFWDFFKQVAWKKYSGLLTGNPTYGVLIVFIACLGIINRAANATFSFILRLFFGTYHPGMHLKMSLV